MKKIIKSLVLSIVVLLVIFGCAVTSVPNKASFSGGEYSPIDSNVDLTAARAIADIYMKQMSDIYDWQNCKITKYYPMYNPARSEITYLEFKIVDATDNDRGYILVSLKEDEPRVTESSHGYNGTCYELLAAKAGTDNIRAVRFSFASYVAESKESSRSNPKILSALGNIEYDLDLSHGNSRAVSNGYQDLVAQYKKRVEDNNGYLDIKKEYYDRSDDFVGYINRHYTTSSRGAPPKDLPPMTAEIKWYAPGYPLMRTDQYYVKPNNKSESNLSGCVPTAGAIILAYWARIHHKWGLWPNCKPANELNPTENGIRSYITMALDMDEGLTSGTTLQDYTSNNRDGTIYEATRVNNGISGNALKFDGYNDRVKLPNSAFNGLTNFSFECWIKTSDTNGGIVTAANYSNDNEFLLYMSNGEVVVYLHDKGVNTHVKINDNKWHHLVFVKDDTMLTLYKDKTSVYNTQTYYNGMSASSLWVSNNRLWLGGEQDSVGGGWQSSQQLSGYLDEVAIYNRVIIPEEIESNYNKKSFKGMEVQISSFKNVVEALRSGLGMTDNGAYACDLPDNLRWYSYVTKGCGEVYWYEYEWGGDSWAGVQFAKLLNYLHANYPAALAYYENEDAEGGHAVCVYKAVVQRDWAGTMKECTYSIDTGWWSSNPSYRNRDSAFTKDIATWNTNILGLYLMGYGGWL